MLPRFVEKIKRMNKRKFLDQVFSFGMTVSTCLMIWNGLKVVTGSESPVTIVNGSMEPMFFRGDLLFLTNKEESVRVGEIVVFKIEGYDNTIVSRVIRLHEKENGTVKFLTRGDNIGVYDRGLYTPIQLWLTRKDLVGRARGFLPYVGKVKLIMIEYLTFQFVTLAGMWLYVLVRRE